MEGIAPGTNFQMVVVVEASNLLAYQSNRERQRAEDIADSEHSFA